MAADLTLIKTSVGFLRGLFVSSEAGGGWSVLNDMVVPSKPVRITALIFYIQTIDTDRRRCDMYAYYDSMCVNERLILCLCYDDIPIKISEHYLLVSLGRSYLGSL